MRFFSGEGLLMPLSMLLCVLLCSPALAQPDSAQVQSDNAQVRPEAPLSVADSLRLESIRDLLRTERARGRIRQAYLEDSLRPQPRFGGAPIVYLQPETGLALGAGGVWWHRPRNLVRPGLTISSMNLLGLYTLRGQFIGEVRGDLYTDEDHWRLHYRVGYAYFPYLFFGIGNDTRQEDREFYTHRFPMADLEGLRWVGGGVYAGAKLLAEHNRFSDFDSSGALISGEVPGLIQGWNVGLGPRLLYDTRDNIFSAYRGVYAAAGLMFHSPGLGSEVEYRNWEGDLRAFLDLSGPRSLENNSRHILAWQAYAQAISGQPPFHRYALFGGPDAMRGFFQGRYRDQIYVHSQVEYRFPIWRFIRGATFAGVGDVQPDWQGFRLDELRYGAGVGLRLVLSPKDRNLIRLDYARGSGGNNGFYLQFRESF